MVPPNYDQDRNTWSWNFWDRLAEVQLSILCRIITKEIPPRPRCTHTQIPGKIRTNRLRPILLFDIETNMQNKYLGRLAIKTYEELDALLPKQCGSRASKSEDIQNRNIRLFYNLIRLKWVPYPSIFEYLISNYDLVAHRIAFLWLQQVNILK